LREEAELYLGRGDPTAWSKEALGRCIKLDSFFRETLRMNVFGSITLPRLTLADFTFTDGTKVGAGYYVAAAADVVHQDSKHYSKPHEFTPFRFAGVRERTSENEDLSQDWQHRMTGTSETFLAFGGGRHLWCVPT
jgi:cytochrome P450